MGNHEESWETTKYTKYTKRRMNNGTTGRGTTELFFVVNTSGGQEATKRDGKPRNTPDTRTRTVLKTFSCASCLSWLIVYFAVNCAFSVSAFSMTSVRLRPGARLCWPVQRSSVVPGTPAEPQPAPGRASLE